MEKRKHIEINKIQISILTKLRLVKFQIAMFKTKNILSFGLLLISLIIFSNLLNSCKHDSNLINDLPEVCFESEILPIFQNNCALSGCHNEITAEHGLILNSYNGIIKEIEPGKPDKSSIYRSITNFRSFEFMPPGNVIPQENRTLIRVWIEQGAKNTLCPEIITASHSIPSFVETVTLVNNDFPND